MNTVKSFDDGVDAGLSNTIDEQRKKEDSAYCVGITAGIYWHERFIASATDHPRDFTLPDLPPEILQSFLNLLAQEPDGGELWPDADFVQLESAAERDLTQTPLARYPFGPSFEKQPVRELRHQHTPFLRFATC